MERPIAWFPKSLGELNDGEKDAVRQLKEKTQSYLTEKHHDTYMIRWLIAQNWDVEKASQMFITSMNWRARYKVDTILEDWKQSPFYHFFRAYHPDTISDPREDKPKFRTKQGYFATFVLVGAIDNAFYDVVPFEEVYRHHIWTQENIEAVRLQIFKETERFGGVMVVADLAGVSLSNVSKMVMEVAKAMSQIDAKNYPCSMEKTILINCPYLFSSIWNLVSGLINEATRTKFLFLGGPEEYEPVLKEYFNEDQLPACYGGTVENAFYSKGGLIADSGLDIPKVAVERNTKLTPVKIGARSSWDYELVVTDQQGTIFWEFCTQYYDVGFGLFYKEKKDGPERQLLEITRFNSHLMAQRGFHSISTPGVYLLRFDNTYSMFYGKDLEYEVYFEPSK